MKFLCRDDSCEAASYPALVLGSFFLFSAKNEYDRSLFVMWASLKNSAMPTVMAKKKEKKETSHVVNYERGEERRDKQMSQMRNALIFHMPDVGLICFFGLPSPRTSQIFTINNSYPLHVVLEGAEVEVLLHGGAHLPHELHRVERGPREEHAALISAETVKENLEKS